MRSECDGGHSRSCGQDLKSRKAVQDSPTDRSAYKLRVAAQGPGAKRGPRADLPPRGAQSAAPALSAGPGAALADFKRWSLDPKLHMHAPVDPLGVRPAAEACRRLSLAFVSSILPATFRPRPARMRPDLIRFGSVPGKTGVVRHRVLILRARRIVFGVGASRRRQSGEAKRDRCGARGHRLQLRRLAPVLFDTSATIFDIAASISASVRVRSRGCRISWMAIDFAPSGRPSPR